MARRVVITGMGVVTATGIGIEAFWRAAKEGRSGISRITAFDPSEFATQIAGEVKGFDAKQLVGNKWAVQSGRPTHFAIAAAEEAIRNAGIDLQAEDRERIGLILSNTAGAAEVSDRAFYALYEKGPTFVNTFLAIAWFYTASVGQISIRLGLKGYGKAVLNDSSGGADAIGYAAKLIRNDEADIVIAGGTEAPFVPILMLHFMRGGMLSTANEFPEQAYRPFDVSRDGVVLGEGAGIVILEEMERARRRRAPIMAEVAGYGATFDAYDALRFAPDGVQFARAMRLALEKSGLKPEDIDYINADAHATVDGDRIEAHAIKAVFGDYTRKLPVSAPKAGYGNLFGGAAPVDVVTTVLAMRDGIVPPTPNLINPDPECDLDLPTRARPAKIRAALINSRGQGGTNAALVVKQIEG